MMMWVCVYFEQERERDVISSAFIYVFCWMFGWTLFKSKVADIMFMLKDEWKCC